jgi:DNA-binding MarR family transcriptional regulator
MNPERPAAPDASEAPGGEEELLVLWELVQTAHLAARTFRELFATVGLTPTQFGVLACLADGDDFTKAELARALMVRPQSMDPVIEALLAERLVERDGPPRRGRAAGITITSSGLDRLTRIRPHVSAVNAPARIGIEADHVPLLVAQLRTIRERLAT